MPLPDGLDPVTAAPLTDAGLTPYHAIRRSWPKLVPGTTAVVVGIGGLGHLAVQILKATTAARVVAVDTRPEALALAVDEGADHTVTPGGDAVPEIRVSPGGGAPTSSSTSWDPMPRSHWPPWSAGSWAT